jgi:hypothetical protein
MSSMQFVLLCVPLPLIICSSRSFSSRDGIFVKSRVDLNLFARIVQFSTWRSVSLLTFEADALLNKKYLNGVSSIEEFGHYK